MAQKSVLSNGKRKIFFAVALVAVLVVAAFALNAVLEMTGAFKGRCTCTDSDGRNYFVKGSAYTSCAGATPSPASTDYCVSASTVKEYYCRQGKSNVFSESVSCSYGCVNGACLSSPQNVTTTTISTTTTTSITTTTLPTTTTSTTSSTTTTLPPTSTSTTTTSTSSTTTTTFSNTTNRSIRPNPPSNLVATVSGTSIVLTWVDNSLNENGFAVYRDTSINGSFPQIGYTGENRTTYTDSTVSRGITYYYKVKAFNAAPTSPSEPSNTANATVPSSSTTTTTTTTTTTRSSTTTTTTSSTTTTTTGGTLCKYLLSYDRDGGVTPSHLATNLSRIESMSNFPYDGVLIHSTAGNDVMKAGVNLDPTTVSNEFSALRNLAVKPTKLKHNMARVLLKDPGDMFDDAGWNAALRNFGVLAKALKDLNNSGFGVDGIIFDNEGPYSRPACSVLNETHGFWNLPLTSSEATEFNTHRDCWPYIRNWGTYGASQYQAQALARGKSVMQALIANWSGIKLMFMHSSDVSCTGTQSGTGLGLRQNDVSYANDMLGSFAVGLAEGAYGTNAKAIDGGEESYGYITEAKFDLSYSFRDSMMPTYMDGGQLACQFIPSVDKSIWSSLFDIGFGLYNKAHYGGGQTSSTIGEATRLALSHSDNYVWFYTEGVNSIDSSASNYIGSAWMTPIIAGRNAVPRC